jgi:hypothetical protein
MKMRFFLERGKRLIAFRNGPNAGFKCIKLKTWVLNSK